MRFVCILLLFFGFNVGLNAFALTPKANKHLEENDVLEIQGKLFKLGYNVGEIDGKIGQRFINAVVAFQKLHQLNTDGVINYEFLVHIDDALEPIPVKKTKGYHIEIDIPRQILVLYNNNIVQTIMPISSGDGKGYTRKDGTNAPTDTPIGTFKIQRKINAEHRPEANPEWVLYYPLYFYGPYAIHGADKITPTNPASHGCIRIPYADSKWFNELIPLGITVFISKDPLPVKYVKQ